MHDKASAAALLRHRRVRERALVELTNWPTGAPAMAGDLDEKVLLALRQRGLVERRYVLTKEGQREAARVLSERQL